MEKLLELNLRNVVRLILIKPLEVRAAWIVAILKPSSHEIQWQKAD
jgi:hypothetical protein